MTPLNIIYNKAHPFIDAIYKNHILGRPGSKRSIFQTSFLGLLSVVIHLNEVAKGQITQNMMKIGLKGT